ncbi:MAG: deoxynucleoside kinase, partial [Anaerolineae bacterium]|nr:deoxynucleoside kinase [Anaerolineae bacterium]
MPLGRVAPLGRDEGPRLAPSREALKCIIRLSVRRLDFWPQSRYPCPWQGPLHPREAQSKRWQESPLRNHFFLAIEGPIGVGKTTLARLAHRDLGGELLLEVFEENPFLSRFYQDRARYAFQTQLFFLLSRYRQQRSVVPATLARTSLVSDYTFAKDRLFAHLNLAQDELEMYERVHYILAENIPTPTLVVYLRADTDVLMQRIAHRDRPYERGMSRAYIEEVRQAYERFFGREYREAPVLTIDTDDLDIVRREEDLQAVLGRIRAALEE